MKWLKDPFWYGKAMVAAGARKRLSVPAGVSEQPEEVQVGVGSSCCCYVGIRGGTGGAVAALEFFSARARH